MHLRISSQRRGDKVYRYAQLVQSCRDERGKSTQRVVKHLGRLPEPIITAIQQALQAHSADESLVLGSEVEAALAVRDVASRRYLDVAVLADCWTDWGLDELLGELAGPSEATVPFAKTVLALAVQRCCAPGSKLQATRWVPQTALPELLHFDPLEFNNTRVHRVLDRLHAITPDLQRELAVKVRQATGGFRALFMDVTDTWFEGMGCPLAEQTRTKTEMPNKRCIAIVLLVNELGYPLRWSVVGGKTKDWTAMRGLLNRIGEVEWLHGMPIVFDRAMGNLATVAELKAAGLWFLTAAHRTSITSYTTELLDKSAVFADVALGLTDESYDDDIQRVAEVARAAGFVEIRDRLFAIDLGVRQPACETVDDPETRPLDCTAQSRRGRGTGLAKQLVRAQALGQRLEADPHLTHRALAVSEGLSRGRVGQLVTLLRLNRRIQAQIAEAGDTFPLSESDVWPLRKLEPAEQDRALEDLLRAVQQDPASRKSRDASPARQAIGALRLVAYFNPRLFVDIRRRRKRHLQEIQEHVAQVNEELANAKRSRKEAPTYRKFSRELERRNYLDAFDLDIEPIELAAKNGRPITSFRGRVTLKTNVWNRRRTHDGFVLLLGHPSLPQTGRQLVQLYRDKDVVEKDFQSIKSVIGLRPLFHYREPKVLAHVAVCMLALLLQRTLRNRLRDTGVEDVTAPAAIDILSRCRLGQREPHALASPYHLTQLDADQERLLAALQLTHLGDQRLVAARIRHRR